MWTYRETLDAYYTMKVESETKTRQVPKRHGEELDIPQGTSGSVDSVLCPYVTHTHSHGSSYAGNIPY